MRRLIYVVLDGVGVGALPDAAEYGDEGSDTLGNVSRVVRLRLPFLESLGLGNIAPLIGVPPVKVPLALTARLCSSSAGKDSTVGHWEQMGIITRSAFPTYPNGFPMQVIDEFSRRIGRDILGNRPASGTEIIASLGDEHVATGKPIVYTSADSVFQIAAHTSVVPLKTLYSWCEIARSILVDQNAVARVIARPFAGPSGMYRRTPERRDYSLAPPGPTYLDRMASLGVPVLALGKIAEIYAGRGVSASIKVTSNEHNLSLLSGLVRGQGSSGQTGLVMSNLVDFDTLWGHRNDVEGFARGLEAADAALGAIAEALGPDDRLLITADHGVDPTTAGTDHSREYVPLLFYPRPKTTPTLVCEGQMADAGATVFEYLTEKPAHLEGITLLRPVGGRQWRRPTPAQASSTGSVAGMPGRVGPEEAAAAGRWLLGNLGPAPSVGVVLGSGICLDGLGEVECEVCYRCVPDWRVGSVEGHPYMLAVVARDGQRWAVLQGRIHEYEGYDLSEVQLPVRSLRAWGVRRVVLTSAGGAIDELLSSGAIMVAEKVLDLQYPAADGAPQHLQATSPALRPALVRALSAAGATPWQGLHASVPGPQYETPAESSLLREAGVTTVSMTPAGELRAAHDEALEVAVLTVVTNVGETTHAEVLASAVRSTTILTSVLASAVAEWP